MTAWRAYGDEVDLGADLEELLVAVADAAAVVVAVSRRHGEAPALTAGTPTIATRNCNLPEI